MTIGSRRCPHTQPSTVSIYSIDREATDIVLRATTATQRSFVIVIYFLAFYFYFFILKPPARALPPSPRMVNIVGVRPFCFVYLKVC